MTLSGSSLTCIYTPQDQDAGDKSADGKSSYTGSMKEPEPGRGMFPQPLEGICQRGEQIGAGLHPITGKPETHWRTWTNEEKVAVWEKAAKMPGKDAAKIRMDSADHEIHWDDYGKREARWCNCIATHFLACWLHVLLVLLSGIKYEQAMM